MSTSTACTIPASILRSTPFNLPWGSEIYAYVIAINSYGDSSESSGGSGAKILTKSDAPVSLRNDPSITNANRIGISWVKPEFNGGS
jgi:hypothetical protein